MQLRRYADAALLGAALVAAGCAAPSETHTIALQPLNASRVTGTVTLADAGRGRTRVDVRVDPAGHPDMPAHIHPGRCTDLVPQPRHPLNNVVNGSSTTIVPAALGELLGGNLAVNLHRSSENLHIYTACADLR